MFRAPFCFAALLLPFALVAQNALVSGRVVDASDAALPKAGVELTNRQTGIRTATVTNEEGYFVLPPLPPGVYDAAASAPGFSSSRLEAVTLEVGQSKTLTFQLRPGEVKESITVTDAAPLITVNRSDRGTLVENKFVGSIPLNLRNPLFLLTLTPGITTGRLAGDNTASQSTTNNFRINGGRAARARF
jgi:hypothetical protein